MELLDEIVRECLVKYVGGEVFFNHLDELVQKKPIIHRLLDLVPYQNKNIVVSGKFGIFFTNYVKNYYSKDMNVIIVNGGLRVGEKIVDLSYMESFIRGSSFTFIDDSFYSGMTRDTVKVELERLGGTLEHTYCAYDGSKVKDEKVSSLYRYYDNIK